MDLGPKSPSNEFVENELENWALVNQTNFWMDSDVERKKRKGVCVEVNRPRQVQGGLFLYIVLNFSYKFDYWMFQCFFPPPYFCCLLFLFISSPLLVPTSHVYIRGLVLIFDPSAPSINLHVVAVRLKHTVQISPPH